MSVNTFIKESSTKMQSVPHASNPKRHLLICFLIIVYLLINNFSNIIFYKNDNSIKKRLQANTAMGNNVIKEY